MGVKEGNLENWNSFCVGCKWILDAVFVEPFWNRDGKLEAFISSKRAHLSKSEFLGYICKDLITMFCNNARHVLFIVCRLQIDTFCLLK